MDTIKMKFKVKALDEGKEGSGNIEITIRSDDEVTRNLRGSLSDGCIEDISDENCLLYIAATKFVQEYFTSFMNEAVSMESAEVKLDSRYQRGAWKEDENERELVAGKTITPRHRAGGDASGGSLTQDEVDALLGA